MATEPVHQPVQRHRLHLDVDIRRRQPGPAQPSNQTSANLPNGLIVLIQDLSRLVVARRLGDERNSDLHLQSSFGIEGKEFLDGGEKEHATLRSETSSSS
jgi:hypothetical protein